MTPEGLDRMSEEECWCFVEQHDLGRVAIVEFHRPLVYPVNYVVDHRTIVFRTAPGAKLVAAALQSHAVLEVDEADRVFRSGSSVMVHGMLHEITEPGEREQVAALPLHPWAPGDRDHFVRLEPDRISGQRITPTGVGDGLGADAG